MNHPSNQSFLSLVLMRHTAIYYVRLTTLAQPVMFAHASLFPLVLSTLDQAIAAGFLI